MAGILPRSHIYCPTVQRSSLSDPDLVLTLNDHAEALTHTGAGWSGQFFGPYGLQSGENTQKMRIVKMLSRDANVLATKLYKHPFFQPKGGVVAWCAPGSMFLGWLPNLYPVEWPPWKHTQGPIFCTLQPLLAYREFFFLNLMLVTGSRLPISAPCTHLRNKPCTDDNTGWITGISISSATGLMCVTGGGFWIHCRFRGGHLNVHKCLLGCMLVQDLFTTQFVPNRDATPISRRRANDSCRHPIPVGAVVVHRQSGDKPGQLRFRHCGSGGHRIRKRTHGARTFQATPPNGTIKSTIRLAITS